MNAANSKRGMRDTGGIVCCIALALIVAAMGMQGCGSVQVRPVTDPEIRAALLRETGFTLAYYALARESDQAIERVDQAVGAASAMLETHDVAEVTRLVVAYVQDFPQWKTGVEGYDVLIGRAVGILTLLIQVDLSVPAKYQEAKAGLGAFLAGAGEGIAAQKKARGPRAEERGAALWFDLAAFEADLEEFLRQSRAAFWG